MCLVTSHRLCCVLLRVQRPLFEKSLSHTTVFSSDNLINYLKCTQVLFVFIYSFFLDLHDIFSNIICKISQNFSFFCLFFFFFLSVVGRLGVSSCVKL